MSDVQILQNDAVVVVTATSDGQTAFAFDFPVFEAAHVKAVFEDVSAGTLTDLVETTDFTVAGLNQAAGGTISLTGTVTVVTGDKLTIYRSIPIARLNDYQQSGDFLASVVNEEQDTIFMSLQELRRDVDRSVKTPIGGSQIVEFPDPVADKVLVGNAGGTGFENGPDLADITDAATNATAAATSASAAAASAVLASAMVAVTPTVTGTNQTLAPTDIGKRYVSSASITITADPAVVNDQFFANLLAGAGTKITINDGTSDVAVLYAGDSATIYSNGSALYVDERRALRQGSWLPDVQDQGGVSATLLFPTGQYSRIGRQVDLKFSLVIADTTGMSAGDVVQVHGVPFSAADELASYGSFNANNVSNLVQPATRIIYTEDYIEIVKSVITSDTFTIVSEMTAGSALLVGSISYNTDDP